MAADTDLYAVLGVAKTAPADELRQAYRKLAKRYHPDVNPGDAAAEERFKRVNAAYDVLSDKSKRSLYDEFGPVGLREGFDPRQARAYAQQAGAAGPFAAGDGGNFDIGDIFSEFFGGRGQPQMRRRGRDIVATVHIDFAQAVRGAEVTVQVPSANSCPACHGAGQEPGSADVCYGCGGAGQVQGVQGGARVRGPCQVCHGSGRAGPACRACSGTGRAPSAEPITVRVPPGADNGSRLRVAQRGEPGAHGGPPGDLFLETRVRPHPHFTRDKLDLFLRLPVTLDEAYRGAAVPVPTPTGAVTLRIPPRSQQGARLRLRGKGISRGSTAGDLYVDLEVRLPDTDNAALAAALQEANAAYSVPVRGELQL